MARPQWGLCVRCLVCLRNWGVEWVLLCEAGTESESLNWRAGVCREEFSLSAWKRESVP